MVWSGLLGLLDSDILLRQQVLNQLAKSLQTIWEQVVDDFFIVFDKVTLIELEFTILVELPKDDQQAPRVRRVRLQSFKENSGYLVFDNWTASFVNLRDNITDLVSVWVRIPKLVNCRIYEANSRFFVQELHHAVEDILHLIFGISALQKVQNYRVDHRVRLPCLSVR